MNKYLILLLLSLSIISCQNFSKNDNLRLQIIGISDTTDATVGVAIMDLSNGDTLTFNGNMHFPMQSVFKFHLALAVLNETDKGNLALNQQVSVRQDEWVKETWSPLRDETGGKDTAISVEKLIRYAVSKSDNNACDILFRLVGGAGTVNKFIHDSGITDISIQYNEEEMQKEWGRQFENWTTPYASVLLLEKFYQGKILSDSLTSFLWNAMIQTETGGKRIRAGLPAGTIAGDKTGTSSQNEQGIIAAVNDIAIVEFGTDRAYAIAVFITDSKESYEANNKVIADISKIVWEYFINLNQQ